MDTINLALESFGKTVNETHSRGAPYEQLHKLFPVLEPLYFDFEKRYDSQPILDIMVSNNYWLPVASVIIYLLFCHFGVRYMENLKPFGLNKMLAVWNLFLSVFSTYGAMRTVPHMIYRITTKSFETTVCEEPFKAFGSGACGLAVQLFILSKIPELIDTVFIVLRKKPLIFLHWYHHVTVLLYCWNAYVTEAGAGLYFVSMNYTVHAVMYFYYFLQAIKYIPKWFPSWIITIMQISQMVVGTFIVVMSIYYYNYGGAIYPPTKCNNNMSNLIAGGVIYTSYLYLFVEFAVKRFIFGSTGNVNMKLPKKRDNMILLFFSVMVVVTLFYHFIFVKFY